MAARRARRRYFSQINVIPFVDVTLVLLVIFMAAVPALIQGLKVELPHTRTVESVPTDADHAVVTLRKDGRIFLDETPIGAADIEDHVRALGGTKLIYVRADSGLPYGEMVRILDAIKRAGVTGVHLVTEPHKDESAQAPGGKPGS